MNKFLPVMALLLLCLGCAPPNKTSKQNSTSPSPLHEKKVESNQQIAPGTCYLSLVDCVVLSENDRFSLKAKVDKVNAYGSGFLEVFQKEQEIVISITKEHADLIAKKKSISCIITQVRQMNDNSFLKLLEIK